MPSLIRTYVWHPNVEIIQYLISVFILCDNFCALVIIDHCHFIQTLFSIGFSPSWLSKSFQYGLLFSSIILIFTNVLFFNSLITLYILARFIHFLSWSQISHTYWKLTVIFPSLFSTNHYSIYTQVNKFEILKITLIMFHLKHPHLYCLLPLLLVTSLTYQWCKFKNIESSLTMTTAISLLHKNDQVLWLLRQK